MHLGAAGIETIEEHGVTGSNVQARRQGTVPAGMCGLGGEAVFGHRGSLDPEIRDLRS
jgi:hypothetical protein